MKGAPIPASRQSTALSGLACLVRARRPASPHPPLSRGIKTRRPSLLFHFSSSSLLTPGHPPRSCSGLRPLANRPSPIVECCMRHRPPLCRGIAGLPSLDLSTGHPTPFQLPILIEAFERPESCSLNHCSVSLLFLLLAQLYRRWFAFGAS